MRTLLFAVLIALLPLRAWMGDAMAVSMLPVQAAPAAAAQADAPPPCPDHATAASADHGGSTADAADHRHAACDVCNGPVLAQTVHRDQAPALRHGLLEAPAERFASSVPLPGIKPPIS